MNAPDSLSRRDALKTLGAGAALLGLGALSTRTLGAEPARSPLAMAGVKQPFALPALGYAYDALEPHIDARTMEIHHTKHHQTYINNALVALAEYPELRKYSGEELIRNLDAIPDKIRLAVRNNVGGHVNHSLFWKAISPGGGKPSSDLSAAFPRFFGSFDAFQRLFEETALKRFGSGWVWLVATEEGPLGISSTPNQDSPVSDGGWPILGLDVWEHAYYLKYQNVRADYIKAFWNVVNWTEVSANFDRVLKYRPEWARGAM